MQIRIDGRSLTVFSGARVIDALRSLDPDLARSLSLGTLRVTDRWGHETLAGGELTEGQELRTEAVEPPPRLEEHV